MQTKRLEASVVHRICTQLDNLKWVVDEKRPDNNVTQQRVKTRQEQEKLKKAHGGQLKYPDFVLYEQGTNRAIGVIEAKRPGESLEKALHQAKDRYAACLGTPLIFAYNDTFVETRYLYNDRPLKIDGEDVRQFIDHATSLRFVSDGSEILSGPQDVQMSREQLITVFKRQANLLREAGLQGGLDRFGAFSDILFLKLMDERSQLYEQIGRKPLLKSHLRWPHIQDMKKADRLDYVKKVVWPEMNTTYGSIFGNDFPIQSDEIFDDIVNDLSNLNFTSADSDVKGDAFEYFLKNAYQAIKIKDLGEYFTPRNIVRTMVSMVDPKVGEKIYDPFCGTGGFLIEAFKYISLRVKRDKKIDNILRRNTVYGVELTATARVAKMNMILFGDGHNNVTRNDSFANPIHGQYDIILTNPPYSQNTRHGNLYSISSSNGDAIALQHCLEALTPDGRAAILVKEDFLTAGGDLGKVREMILKSAKNFTISSLPRRLFEPYTPTKTSIIYFEKAGKRKKVYFFVVKDVGHTFGARQKRTKKNDLPDMLDCCQNENFKHIGIDYHIENQTEVQKQNSLWIYDYIEVEPHTSNKLEYLGNHIEQSGTKISPSDFEDDEIYRILGVSNIDGVFFNEEKEGREIRQSYIRVSGGDIVYNPHRVNVGSIGVVPEKYNGDFVSGIYVVFRPIDPVAMPPRYICNLLKSDVYINIIKAYDTKYGAVRANLNYEMLSKIKVVIPTPAILDQYKLYESKIMECNKIKEVAENEKDAYINSLLTDELSVDKAEFDAIITKASQPQTKE
ncbi:MAG: N-6 DNA methylase [Spirochaetia bacterium]|nr:N-6 DNA methylase [Spirochaetia bacterium]